MVSNLDANRFAHDGVGLGIDETIEDHAVGLSADRGGQVVSPIDDVGAPEAIVQGGFHDHQSVCLPRQLEDTARYLEQLPECNGRVGAVGYCLGGKLCYLMCCRTDIDCAVAYYGTYIEHNIREVGKLHRPFMLHMAMKDRWVQAEVNELLERRLAPNPLVTIHKYPGADHAFARHGGRTYSKPEADRALGLTVDFFRRHLGG
jgi:hypothetical protein